MGQASESDCKVTFTMQATIKELKKELKKVIQNTTRQKKQPNERKCKMESMDETTHKTLMGKVSRLIWVYRKSAISRS